MEERARGRVWATKVAMGSPKLCSEPHRDIRDDGRGLGSGLGMEYSRKEEEGYTRSFPSVREMPLERKEADPSLVGPGPTPLDSRAWGEGQAVPDGLISRVSRG